MRHASSSCGHGSCIRAPSLIPLRDDSLRDASPEYLSRVAAALAADAVMSCAWKLLALHPDDGPLKRSETIAGAAGLLELVPDAAADALRRLEIWKTTEFPRGESDFFKVAEAALAKQRDGSAATVFDFPLPDEEPEPEVPTGPSVVVICGDRVVEKGLPHAWKDLLDEKLPLVVCRDAVVVRERLVLEYPHAVREVAMLTQDLRSGEPVRIKPTILLGPPGGGKSRLVRRFAEIVSPALYVSEFGGELFDGMYSGTPKGWSTAQASVPARAIMMSKIANPICMTDEIDKAGESTHNGNLWSAITPHLEKETARNYPRAASMRCSI